MKAVIFDMDDVLIHEGFDTPRPANETRDVLEMLKERGVRMAVASHNDDARSILEAASLAHYFQYIVGRDETSKVPLVLEVCAALNLKPAECAYVDDCAWHSTEVANTLDMRAITVDYMRGVSLQDFHPESLHADSL